MSKSDVEVLLLSLKYLSEGFDRFVGACRDENGAPQAPAQGEVNRARACLPKTSVNGFKRELEKVGIVTKKEVRYGLWGKFVAPPKGLTPVLHWIGPMTYDEMLETDDTYRHNFQSEKKE